MSETEENTKEVCPYCNKEFKRLDMHKCDKKPLFNKKMENMEWKHYKGEPNWNWKNEGGVGYIHFDGDDANWDDFYHDITSILQKFRKPIKVSKNDKIIKIIGV